MSIEEQKSAIGDMVMAKAASQTHLGTLRHKLRTLERTLRELSNKITYLVENPEAAATGGSSPVDFQGAVDQIKLDERLVPLVKDYYAEHTKLKQLAEELAKLGL